MSHISVIKGEVMFKTKCFRVTFFLAVVLSVSCNNSSEPVIQQATIKLDVKSISIDLKKLEPVNNCGYDLHVLYDFSFKSDSTWYSGDTLKFSNRINDASGKLLIYNNYTITNFELTINYKWTKVWYDYSKPKWDPNYYRLDSYIYKLMVSSAHQLITNNNTYTFVYNSSEILNNLNLSYENYEKLQGATDYHSSCQGKSFKIIDAAGIQIKIE